MDNTKLLPAERAFRMWMLISALMFGFAVPFFFFGGAWIVPVINFISGHLCSLPPYPLPPDGMEGAFWRVLGVSMMTMLTWASWKIFQDVRRYSHLTPIILLSKCCSTSLYLVLFASDHHLAYLIGALTDGPIFVLTFVLWYLSRPADQCIDAREEDILAAIGEAFAPPGGAFGVGFADLRRECLADVRRSLASLSPMPLLGTRLLIRAVNIAPLLAGLRLGTLLSAAPAERSALLTRLESHRWWLFRGMVMGLKTVTMLAFFNQDGVAQTVGYDRDARIRP
jgi:hypothetical protein